MNALKAFRFLLLAGFAVTAFASSVQAASVMGRHVFMLHPGVDAVWGTYLLVVDNPGGHAMSYSFPVMLPEETVDFQPQQGIKPEELVLGEDGVMVDANFERASNLVAIGFKVEAKNGKALMTLTTPFAVEEFAVMVPDQKMKVLAPGLTYDPNVQFSGRRMATWYRNDLPAGERIQFEVIHVPRGRGEFWLIGGFAGVFLVLASSFLALRSRPSDETLQADAYAVVAGSDGKS